jgi:Icc-related predicted phosphoesterase
MRCLIVADLHYSLPQFDWLVAAADQFDLVVFAGDALDLGSIVDFRAQIVVVKKYLALVAARTQVIICSGNHDLDDRNPEGEKIARWIGEVRDLGIARDGDTLPIGETLFTICPWWDGPLVKASITEQLGKAAVTRAAMTTAAMTKAATTGAATARGATARGATTKAAATDVTRWIWVHHAPPANSPVSWGGKRFYGDADLAGWIARYQPSMVVSGHVHQSPFISVGSWYDRLGSTWVFNTGRQPGRPPTYIVLEPDNGRAFWLGAGEAAWVDLNGPLRRPAQPVTEAPDWLRALGRIRDPFLARPAAAAG